MDTSVINRPVVGAKSGVERADHAGADLHADHIPQSWSRIRDEEILAGARRSQSPEALMRGLGLRPANLLTAPPSQQRTVAGIVSAVSSLGRRLRLKFVTRNGATNRRA